jgi:hypothetical protein
MNKWFTANKLALNLDKTSIIEFIINDSPEYALSIGYSGKCIEMSVNMKLQIEQQ